MKLKPYSDLHVEFQAFEPVHGDEDYVVLAGDIHNGDKVVPWILSNFPDPSKVIYCPGNHEFYHRDWKSTKKMLSKQCADAGILGLIEPGDRHIIGNNKLLIGGTLWTDHSFWYNKEASMRSAAYGMNDYRLIQNGNRPLTVDDTLVENVRFIQKMEDYIDEYPETDIVVVTHMAPTKRSVTTQFMYDPVTAAYCSTLDEWISARPNIKYWQHGHIHSSSDYMVGEHCRVVANPRGYANIRGNENRSFQDDLIIEV